MKKILVLGVGAQGSTIVQRLDEEPSVQEIICADYDSEAVADITKITKKTRGVQIDCRSLDDIIDVATGVDLIVNALPLHFGKQVLEAAIAVGANYQDFSSPTNIIESCECDDCDVCDNYDEKLDSSWIDGIKLMYSDYSKQFEKIGKTAITATGSAPGLIHVIARRLMRELDSCDTIYLFVYEGVEAARFQPFWWSPYTALEDMSESGYAYENGKLIRTPAFGLPIKRSFSELGGEYEFIEHTHDEPVHMGINADKFFKGAKNIYFKYGGVGATFAKPLYRAGLLSRDEMEIDGVSVVPFDVILAHLPPAPKTKKEIQEIIDEGIIADVGCFVVEAHGKKDGKDVEVRIHVSAPSFLECFERASLTAEMYLTGQSGFIFTKMFIEDKYHQLGLISSDMLTDEQVDYYLEFAKKFDITYEIQYGK